MNKKKPYTKKTDKKMISSQLRDPRAVTTDNGLEKITRLGGGTYGRVYEARQENEIYAVKSNNVCSVLGGSIASVRELDILNTISPHPFCIKMHQVIMGQPFKDGSLSPLEETYVSDKMYFLLEKGTCDGESYIKMGKALVNEKKIFMLNVLLAVEFLHSRGIYHCDIKPANIICMMNDKGELEKAKLSDFGMSQYMSRQTMSLRGIVTLWYRAPEISLNQEYDLGIDIWSIGCIMYELFSTTNSKFMKPKKDVDLLNTVMGKLKVSEEFYQLAKQLYKSGITKSYGNLQANLKNLEQQLGYTNSQISQFDSLWLGGKQNSGSYNEFVEILRGMLTVNPEDRWTAAKCLNHRFFAGHRKMIDEVRSEFGINEDGVWILKPEGEFNYKGGTIRDIGMRWFSIIYLNREQEPINQWYTDRMFFHAIEMFDRYLMKEGEREVIREGDVVIWINTFLYISSKYFRMMKEDELGLEEFRIGIDMENEYEIFRDRVQEFEEYVIKEVFKYEIYKETVYEVAEEYLTDTMILGLLQCITNQQIATGTTLSKFWKSCLKCLEHKNDIKI